MNSIKNAIGDVEHMFGKGYVANNPVVLAAILQADATSEVAAALRMIQGEMNQFNPQVDAIGNALNEIAETIKMMN